MNGDIQITVTGSSSADLPPTLLTHIDMLAGTLYGTPGWAIRVDIDPGIVLIASPSRDTATPETHFTACFTPEDGEDG